MDNNSSNKMKISIGIDFRIITLILLIIIVTILAVWRPWSASITDDSRTITVTGDVTLKAEPDEYVFYPSYEFVSPDKATALTKQSEKNRQIIDGLKDQGVDESNIKNSSSSYGYTWEDNDGTTYTLGLVVTVSDKETAQKVQDFLITTQPQGQISPQASFSETKRKSLESQARDKATEDARNKAEQSAKNTGASLGRVKSIQDGDSSGNFIPMPLYDSRSTGASEQSTSQSITVNPGQNDLVYSVTVTYYLK